MGVIVNKNDALEDELSRRISADLRERASETSLSMDEKTDYVEDTDYVKDLKKTSRFGWVWIVLITLAIISLISIVFF